MRFVAIAALFSSLAVALPAVAPAEQGTSVAVRGENAELSITARDDLSKRQGFITYDMTWAWPETTFTGGGRDAQFTATNLNDGTYEFLFTTTGASNTPDLHFRISYGGVTLGEKTLRGTQARATVIVKKTGDNFNALIEQA